MQRLRDLSMSYIREAERLERKSFTPREPSERISEALDAIARDFFARALQNKSKEQSVYAPVLSDPEAPERSRQRLLGKSVTSKGDHTIWPQFGALNEFDGRRKGTNHVTPNRYVARGIRYLRHRIDFDDIN